MKTAIRSCLVLILLLVAGRAFGQPCVVPDDGSGTVSLPPVNCQYLSPADVHLIIDGLPPGTTIQVSAVHQEFFNITRTNDPASGSEIENFNSILNLQLTGKGALEGWTKNLLVPNVHCETHVGPRTPGQPVQSFDTDMFRLQGQLPPGDPDFDLLRITAGTGFGLPSPGHTTLTRQTGGDWAVDSFFDITYRIDFIGTPGGRLSGLSGSTTATIRMGTGSSGHDPNVIPAGVDLFTTPGCGATFHDFGSSPIPAGFFDPGSDPFTNHVILAGIPVATEPSGVLGPVDTIVQRLQETTVPPGGTGTVPIQIVGLSLQNILPLTVTYGGGKPEFWTVKVSLSSTQPQLVGGMMITRDSCGQGGSFTAMLPVRPRLVFTRVSDGAVRVADQGLPPLQFNTQHGRWLGFNPPGFQLIQAGPGLKVDHDGSPSTPPMGPLPASSDNFFPGMRIEYCQPGCSNPIVMKRLTEEDALLAKHGILPAQPPPPDRDQDGVPDDADNCPDKANPLQEDRDYDGIGDVCDNCPDWFNPCQQPCLEVDHFPNTAAIIELCTTGGSETVVVQGPTTVHVEIDPAGHASDTDGDGKEQVTTHLVEMHLTGSNSLGAVTVELNGTMASNGEIEEQTNATPGTLDVRPFRPTGLADSFFDVFVKITVQTPTGPLVLVNKDPKRMSTIIDYKPPGAGTIYESPQTIPLYLENGQLSGFSLCAARHLPVAEIDHFPDTAAVVELCAANGSETVVLTGPTTVAVGIDPAGNASDTDGDGKDQVTTRLVAMRLTGSNSIGAVTMELNRAQASNGEIEEQTNATPGTLDVRPFRPTGLAESFFDVFVKITVQTPTGPLVLVNKEPERMSTVIDYKPPGAGTIYESPQTIPLYLENGQLSGFSLCAARHLPVAEIDHFPSTAAVIELCTTGASETVVVQGPTTVAVDIDPAGHASDTDGDGREQVTTHMVAMRLTGSNSLGAVTVELNPAHRSDGGIEEQVNATPGTLDVRPFRPTGLADSFFDIFVKITVQTPTGPLVLVNKQPKRMSSVIDHKPPGTGTVYEFPEAIPLYLENGQPSGITMCAARHLPVAEVDHFPNTTAIVELCGPNGSEPTVVRGPTTVLVDVDPAGHASDTDGDGRDQVKTHLVAMHLTGTNSMGLVSVRLNPTRASGGEIEEQNNATPGTLDVRPFRPAGLADSFFDVFVEITAHTMGGPLVLVNKEPKRMSTVIDFKPPGQGTIYESPLTIPLFLPDGLPSGFAMCAARHIPVPTTNCNLRITCPPDMTVDTTNVAGAVVTYPAPVLDGSCPPFTLACNPPSGSVFPVGVTTVNCMAMDSMGNKVQCAFTVTVRSSCSLHLTCPPDVTVKATSAAGALVTYPTPVVDGTCPPFTLTCAPPSGSQFPIGITTVLCMVTDAMGNKAECTFKVTVRPRISITPGPNVIQFELDGGRLQESDRPEGPYVDVDPQPTPPVTITPREARKFYRVYVGQSPFSFYDTELLELNIQGGNLPEGMLIRESPTRASLGKTAIAPVPGGGHLVHSFFDVFTEVSMDGGQTWLVSTGAPPRMRFTGTAPTDSLPPIEANYVSPDEWHALYAQGIYITNAIHRGFTANFPPPPPGGASDDHTFGSTVSLMVRLCPTCPYENVTAPAQVRVRVTSRGAGR